MEQESPFLRGQKRVSVRRGSLPQKDCNRPDLGGSLPWSCFFLAAWPWPRFTTTAKHSWRFRIESSDDIEVSRAAERDPLRRSWKSWAATLAATFFSCRWPSAKQQLEQIPWVESASVMRFVPNRLRIEIHERTPVAFARVGSQILLTDAGGTLMELPARQEEIFVPGDSWG